MTKPPTPQPRRPLLSPSLTRVWRGPDRLQLGVGTRDPVVLAGVDPRDARFLLDLDGRCDRTAALARAADLGLPATRAEQLLTLLDEAGCLADGATDARSLASLDPLDRDRLAPDVAALSLLPPAHSNGLLAFSRRRAAYVEVRGAGRVGSAVTTLLAASGVGTVTVTDDAAVRSEDLAPLGPHAGSVGRPRSDAAVDAARRTAPNLRRDTARSPDLVVLTGAPVVDPMTADTLLGLGIPHLPVILLETTATVGPLVTSSGGPCLRCLDLHRCDRDPDWPVVAAQLSAGGATGRRGGAGHTSADACDVVLATCAASLAALMVLGWLGARTTEQGDLEDEQDVEPGTTYVLRLPGGRPRARTYAPHPRCGCSWGGRQ
jgi:ThiF family